MPAVLGQLARTSAPAPLADAIALSAFLTPVPDPRNVRGRRYRLAALVTAAAASVLAGARSLTAITEWISDALGWACRALGFPIDPPTGTVTVPHSHTQRQVADKSNEIPAFQALLDTVDLTNSVVTADALHTQHAHGTYLCARGAHYIAQVKANHPGLSDRIRRLPWREITLDHHDRTHHHRLEIRRLKTAAFAHLDYPDARQALQVVRWRKDFTSGKLTIERVYLITSLPPGSVTGTQLAAWIRGHWRIEKLLHHVRDRTFREDDSKIHIERLPRIMAGLRNLAIGIHRQEGRTNIAAALRHAARDYRRPGPCP
ncbi:ISAs1 family transposase [Streptomyces hirsutus]|uniref:ISAs1 family transposase n=1 Tax=Streptomyces hirsutus TaxID=35620 RepID=UPI00368FE4FE